MIEVVRIWIFRVLLTGGVSDEESDKGLPDVLLLV